MNGMILAAGRGERMRPLTCRHAKPALTVLNRPLLSHAMELLHRGGVQRVAVNLHHLPETVEQVVKDWAPQGMEITFFREEEILGTAGGLKNAESMLQDGPFLVCNGDFLLQMDPADALQTHRESGAIVTLVVVPHRKHLSYTPVWVEDGKVLGFGEPPSGETARGTRYIFAGLHVIEPSVLERIPGNKEWGIVRPVYSELLAEGAHIAAHLAPGAWLEFGAPSDYLRRSLRLLDESHRSFVKEMGIEVTGEEEELLVLGTDVHISDGASFVGLSVLGDGAAVGKGSRVERCIVGRGSVVSFGSELSDCILADGIILPPDTRLDHRIIMSRGDDLSDIPGGIRMDELVHFPL
ncbi:MAG: NDP-sugar synthase [Acidobacteria bacterium]|nr:MAG: NDP-sugar synthase [Acidobacteriota bacterium]